MDIVDAQIHLFEPPSERFPWDPAILREPRYAAMVGRFQSPGGSPREFLETMDRHGVSGALVTTPSIYGTDNAYSRGAWERAPERFRVVGLMDPARPDVEDAVAACAADPAFAGLRLGLESEDAVARFAAGHHDRLLAAAERAGLTVCVLSPGRFSIFSQIARAHPELQLVIDHLGLFSVAMLDPAYPDTFALIDQLLALAALENVAVKLTSLPMLSREPYPFADVWPHVHRTLEAFGPERVMWGSDGIVFDHPYGQMIDFLRDSDELGPAERELVLGAALRRVWGWPREEAPGAGR